MHLPCLPTNIGVHPPGAVAARRTGVHHGRRPPALPCKSSRAESELTTQGWGDKGPDGPQARYPTFPVRGRTGHVARYPTTPTNLPSQRVGAARSGRLQGAPGEQAEPQQRTPNVTHGSGHSKQHSARSSAGLSWARKARTPNLRRRPKAEISVGHDAENFKTYGRRPPPQEKFRSQSRESRSPS